jgi:hypothetical protein
VTGGPARLGFATPEEASLGDFPPQHVEVVGAVVREDSAVVWLLTNEAPDYEPYTVFCERRDGRWYEDCGVGGISYDLGMSDEVYERLRGLGHL